MTVDDEMLLAQPELLARAMLSALVYHQSDGVEILLPIYEAQPQALIETPMVTWAKATIATKHQDHRTAITLYQNLVKDYPDNQLFKAHLAQSLIAHRQYKEAYTIIAADPVLAEQMAPYAKAIDKLTKTNIHIGGSAIVDKNTNKPAPSNTCPCCYRCPSVACPGSNARPKITKPSGKAAPNTNQPLPSGTCRLCDARPECHKHWLNSIPILVNQIRHTSDCHRYQKNGVSHHHATYY
ncbi:tetratricopeptide repeat protein [Moraxella haemolytica]|uniref:tetratricopeptide repeat protein n=1 Tax=Moraxella haemolytica TaxID=2904119 RepID=UPI00254387CD|nr:tetratricopeptide repeat protein [Moraxella sp. ZY171148]WII95768.1 tetratricopeptide repeat protein [Moraxella sp. ZY171148]